MVKKAQITPKSIPAKPKLSAGPKSKPVPKKTRKTNIKKLARPAVKVARRSRSIEETIREAEQYEANCARRARSIVGPAKKSGPAKGRIPVRHARHSLPVALPVPVPMPSYIPPPPTATSKSGKSRPGTSGSKAQSSKQVNLKHDSNLPLAQFGVIDICFCIDATGSMGPYLEESKKTIVDIISNIETKVQTEGIELRFAVVTYRDHPPQDSSYVTKVQDFTDDHTIRQYIQKLDATGGGDFPEAVHDGLMVAARDLSWRNYPMIPSVRYIFHVADAPPHGSQFSGTGAAGCLCGMQTADVLHAINCQQIHYRLIKINSHPHLDKMQAIFKKGLTNFQSSQIKQASEMNVRVSDMIIREIMPI